MALDKSQANSLFGPKKKVTETEAQPIEIKVLQPQQETLSQTIDQKPKWETLDKVTVLLKPEQKEGLDRIAKKLMKHRANDLKGKDDKERITTNTLIRALIENFLELENFMHLETLSSEQDVCEWIAKNLRLRT